MAELRTRIVLRNDSTANWLTNESVVLLKGEVGIEFLESGDVKLKIGDGVKTWAELDYFADADTSSLETALADLASKHDTEIAALQEKDSAIEALIGTVTEGKTVVEMIAEAQAAAAYDDTDLVARVTANEDAIAILNGDDTVEGSVDKKVADKVTAEIDAFATKISDDEIVNTFKELVDYVASHGTEAADMAAAIANKVDKEDGSRLITADEIAKLSKLVIDEDTGDVGLSGSISAENVVGLSDLLDKKVNVEDGKSLVNDTLIAKLEAIEAEAQANKIESVKVGDTLLEIIEKTVVVPVGAGLKASAEITIAEDGTLGVGEVNVNKLVQTDSDTLILNGGAAV